MFCCSLTLFATNKYEIKKKIHLMPHFLRKAKTWPFKYYTMVGKQKLQLP